jgi:hypothetical protein
MYILYIFEAVYIAHDISLEKKGLECGCLFLLFSHTQWVLAKGVGPSTTLAWHGWKQPDIPVEVDTGRLETDVGRQEF